MHNVSKDNIGHQLPNVMHQKNKDRQCPHGGNVLRSHTCDYVRLAMVLGYFFGGQVREAAISGWQGVNFMVLYSVFATY